MDLFQRARELYAAGRMHDALEVAQAACDRAPKDARAWALLARVSRHTGMPAASDDAFRRATELDHQVPLPRRLSAERFQELVAEARASLPAAARERLGRTSVRVQALPTPDQVRAGLDPDALVARPAPDALVLFQVNHENRGGGEDALRALVSETLSAS